MKKILKAINVAFSMYSKIPMPRFDWASEDMKYHLCFFPWVGAVIGLLEWGLVEVLGGTRYMGVSGVLLACAIPLLVTGGFHVDGFMDTMDALHSYQDREKKLEILKDPHIGAFSVISLGSFFMVVIAALYMVDRKELSLCLAANFFLSRVLSGSSVVLFPSAKKTGILDTSAKTAGKGVVKAGLYVQGVLCLVFMTWLSVIGMAVIAVTQAIVFGYYYLMSKKQFGGITGDLAGFFVVVSEGACCVTMAITAFVLNWMR